MKNVILFLSLLPFFCSGQVNLNGLVQDANGAVGYANIILMSSNDEFVKGTITNEDGSFTIAIETGSYKLSVSHINYKAIEMEITIEDDLVLPTLLLTENSSELEEVVVTANKSTIKREIDKTVVNIENSPIAQSGNLFDALQSAPGLIIQNDAIAMLGKSSVRVAMDGRMVELSGEELSNFLKSLSGSDVKAFELITNPSAKYEAEGNSGIVNIITKRVKKNKWRNTISMTHNQAKFGWQAFNNNFSYRKNKFSLLFTTAYNSGNRFMKQIIEPNYSTNPQKIDSEQTHKANSLSPRVLMDYNIDELTTVGVQYMGSISKRRSLDDLRTTIFNTDYQPVHYLVANDVAFNSDRYDSSLNFYFDKKLDTLGRRITFNFDVLDYNGSSKNEIFSEAYDENLNFQNVEFANLGEAEQYVNNYSAKLDVEHPLSWVKLSYGLNSTFSKTNYQLDNFNTITGEAVFNPLQSNAFKFKEQIQSAYINGSKQLNKQWEFQFGLRAEYTKTEGLSEETESASPVYENNYFQLFPTFYTRYLKDDNNVFSFNYGRRINRPAYSQLNPARTFISAQSSQQGNPFLLPSFSHNLELTHTFKYNLSTTLSFSHNANAYSFIFDLNDETQEQFITYKNLYKENVVSIMTSYQLNLAKWWSARTLLFYSLSHSKKLNPTDQINLFNGDGLYGSINNQLQLNKAKTITAEINFWYTSAYGANLYRFGETSSLDMALNFRSLIKGMNLTLGVNDLFNTSPRATTSIINGIEHNFIAYPSNRYFRVALSYQFGNEKMETRERGFGNEDVRRRSN